MREFLDDLVRMVAPQAAAKGLAFDPTTYVHTSFDVARLVKDAESTGYKGVYSIELYQEPDAPADTVAAETSMIKAILPELKS